MAETKFTPGPWEAFHQLRLSIIRGQDGEHIADTGSWRDDEIPELRANAHLIAAAPELYAALQKMVDWIDNGDEPAGAYSYAMEALAAARGEKS